VQVREFDDQEGQRLVRIIVPGSGSVVTYVGGQPEPLMLLTSRTPQ
jgi:hypothetical protein